MALKQNIRTFFCSTMSVLLSMIIVFNLSFNAFHTQTEEHHHPEQNCSVNEEFDACHRYLVHHEKSAGCNGSHQHIANKTDECFICNFFKHQQQTIEPISGYFSLTQTGNKTYFNTASDFASSQLIYSFLRGPPSIG